MFEKHVLSALCVGASRLGCFFAFAFVAAWHSEAGREVRSFDAGSAIGIHFWKGLATFCDCWGQENHLPIFVEQNGHDVCSCVVVEVHLAQSDFHVVFRFWIAIGKQAKWPRNPHPHTKWACLACRPFCQQGGCEHTYLGCLVENELDSSLPWRSQTVVQARKFIKRQPLDPLAKSKAGKCAVWPRSLGSSIDRSFIFATRWLLWWVRRTCSQCSPLVGTTGSPPMELRKKRHVELLTLQLRKKLMRRKILKWELLAAKQQKRYWLVKNFHLCGGKTISGRL